MSLKATMSSFRRSARCGPFLEISTDLILPKNMYLTPMSEFQMCLLVGRGSTRGLKYTVGCVQ